MCAKRNDPNQLDWFATPPEKDAPAPPRPTFQFHTAPEPSAIPETPANPPPSMNQTPEPIEQIATPAENPDTAFDPFDSDPFFTTSYPPAPEPEPPATPEEKLLSRITAQPAPVADTSALEQEVRESRTARAQAETALLAARRQVDNLQARCATLESERDSAVAEATRERQLRADAVAARNRPTPMARTPLSTELTASRQPTRGGTIPRRTFQAVLLGSLVLCVVAYTLGRNHAPASSVTIMEETAPVATPITPEPAATEPAPATILPDWPNLSGKDFRLTADGDTRIVVFQYGAFSRGTTLAPAAQRDLAKIAGAFKPVASSFKIEVEGHTDASPVRSTHAYSDNHELGMARASAAAEFLTANGGLPAESVSTSSAGDTRPPHPGKDPETQRKNRTVVLKITRR